MNIICKTTGYFCPEDKTDPETEIENKQLEEQREAERIEFAIRKTEIKQGFKLIKKHEGSYDSSTRTHNVEYLNGCPSAADGGPCAGKVELAVNCGTGDIKHQKYKVDYPALWMDPDYNPYGPYNYNFNYEDFYSLDASYSTNKTDLSEDLLKLYLKICRTE